MAQLRSWWRALTGRSRLDGEMASEMDSHMERYAADLMARGVESGRGAPPGASSNSAAPPAAAEECREAVGLHWPDEISPRPALRRARAAQESHVHRRGGGHAGPVHRRQYRHLQRGGCGAAAALAVSAAGAAGHRRPRTTRTKAPKATRRARTGASGKPCATMPPTWTRPSTAAVRWASTFAADGRVEYVKQQRVSAGFFRVLGIAPLIGREFSADEDQPGGAGRHRAELCALEACLSRGPLGRRAVCHLCAANRTPSSACCRRISRAALRPTSGRRCGPPRPARAAARITPIVARLRPGATWAQADAQIEAVGVRHCRARTDRSDPGVLHLISFQRGLTDDLRSAPADTVGGRRPGAADRLREYRRTAAGPGRRTHARDWPPAWRWAADARR